MRRARWLSSGLEYDPGYYSDTEELIALAKVAGKHGGLYISHVRDEGNEALTSFRELIRIAQEGHLPAQISHIKLATSNVWGKSEEVLQMMADAASVAWTSRRCLSLSLPAVHHHCPHARPQLGEPHYLGEGTGGGRWAGSRPADQLQWRCVVGRQDHRADRDDDRQRPDLGHSGGRAEHA